MFLDSRALRRELNIKTAVCLWSGRAARVAAGAFGFAGVADWVLMMIWWEKSITVLGMTRINSCSTFLRYVALAG